MDFRILGPLEVRDDRGGLSLGGGKQRALLALLLIHPNESLSTDLLIDELWPEQPPPTVAKILQNYVSQLRRVLGDDRLQTQARGYALRVEPGELDLDRFRQRFEEGKRAQAAGDPKRAALLLREALALWRGSPLADFAYEPFARDESGRLKELRLNALSERIDADLALGRHSDLIGELEALVSQQPLQERLREQLMLSLYRSGRQAEALQVYQDARRTLADLGLEPSTSLQRLEQSILTHNPTIEPPASAESRSSAAGGRASPWRWAVLIRNQRLLATMLGAAVVVGVAAAALFVWSDNSVPAPIVTGNAIAIIDPGSNRVTGQIAVGAGPGALALGSGRLWVANTVDQSVSQVDIAGGEVTRTLAVGGIPISVAVGRNAVWIIRRPAGGYPDLIRIDPRFDVVAPGRRLVEGGDSSPNAPASVAAGPGGVWVAAQGGSLERLDPAGKAVMARIDTGNSPASVAIGTGAVWVADVKGNTVARVDPGRNLVTATTPVGNGAVSVATGAGAVWVADRLDDTVVRIDPTTNSVTTTIPVGRAPTGIAVGLGGVWVANSRDGTVSRIDPISNRVVKTIRVGASPQAIAVGYHRVWVSVQTALVCPSARGAGVVCVAGNGIDSLDPAIANTLGSWTVEYATCAGLLNYPDRPAPEGSRLTPEVAAAMPARSADGKSYTFKIRPGFRFSPPSNAPVTAQTFKFSIERALSPRIPDGQGRNVAADIVGVAAYEAGKTRHISGIRVRGNTLTVRLTDESPDILSRLAVIWFCPVPPGTPAQATGVNMVPSAGPYYVTSYTQGQGVVLKRNPNYHGLRPRDFDEIDYSEHVGAAQSVREIEAATGDFAVVDDLPAGQLAHLAARYGAGSPAARNGGQRFYAHSLLGLQYLALNTSRPLLADTNLRRAVNYALDRRAIAQVYGRLAQPTDQYLQLGIPGFRDRHIYPLTQDLARAKRLAHGHGGHAVLYAGVEPAYRAVAQLIRAELARIGINVQIRAFPNVAVYHRAGIRGEPFDMALDEWFLVYPDPSNVLNYLFNGRSIRATANSNHSYFDDPTYNRKLAAAARLTGPRRYAAYQALEADLERNAAPAAPLLNFDEQEFFSARIGCQVYTPIYQIDLAALCLKHRS
jgi:YVTN family beta-propeller protein